MNGPDHYRCAELRMWDAIHATLDDVSDDAALLMAEAQVHATLALAAATLHSGSGDNGSGASSDQWREVTL